LARYRRSRPRLRACSSSSRARTTARRRARTIGPAFLVHDPDDDPDATESPDRWMPRSEAKQLAVDLGYRFEVDGMTDEELAAWADELDR
jgi:hypothetical protein